MRTSTSVVELILCFSIFLSAKITIIPVQAFSYSQRYVSLKTCQKFSPHTSITTTISGETPIPATTLNNLNHHLQNHSKNIISLRLSSSDTSTSTATRITHLSTTNIAKVNGDALDVTAILEEQQQKLILDQKKSILDDFTPRTPTLLQSMILFARFALETLRFNRRKSKHQRRLRKELKQRNKLLMNKKNEDIDDSINLLQEELETEKIKAELETSLSLQERMQKLNQFRKKIVHLVGYTRAIIIPSFAFLILGSLFTSIVPHYYSNSITSIATIASSTAATASAETKAKLIHNLLGLGIFSILMSLTTGLRGSLFWLLGSRGNYNVRTKLHRNLLRQEAAFFDGTETGVLISRLNNDVNKIGNVVSFHVNIVLRQIAQFIFGSVYLLKISPQLSMFTFAGIAAIGYISKVYGDFSRDIAERVQNQLADGSAVAETSFAMSETVRAFDGLNVETQRYELAQYHALELEEISAWAYGTHKFVSDSLQTIMQISLLFACWTIGQQRGSLSAAKLTTFMFYVNFVLESSNEVGDQWAKIMSAMGASSSAFTLIERIPKIMDPLPTDTVNNHYVNGDEQVTNQIDLQQKQKHQKPVIEMSNMTVTYDDMDSITPALQNINLKVYPGDKIAIVGRSGSGKSSMLRTLLRFYDPSWGKCILDGKVLTEYTRNEIANKVVMVEQEPHLFPMTLMENVLYGIDKDQEQPYIENGYALCEIKADSDHDPGCTGVGYNRTMQERVSEALELAGLPMSKENDDLGLTLDTRVGEGGRTLSGGQRQRVAIARALVRVPDVLLLDEPTAALDSKSEIAVVKALKQAMDRTRCMVMVTHRFSPIRSLEVNKVIVLDRGKIAEIGHPEDLLRQEGLYAQMAREQGIVAMDGIAN